MSERKQPKQNVWSSHESAMVLAQLELLLASHHFNLSKKYPVLLRYLVEKTLGGESHLLKERLIGVEVFDRAPDYNTAEDPVVRITAAEIRKRIAQYYHEENHEDELRIELTAGSYVPEFHFSTPLQTPSDAISNLAEVAQLPEEAAPVSASAPLPLPRRRIAPRLWMLVGLFLLALVSYGAWRAWRWHAISPVETVWAPFLNSGAPVLFCIGRPGSTLSEDTQNTSVLDHINQVNALTYDDVIALMSVADVLHAHARSFVVKSSARTTFSDLQAGPTVYIGAFDNTWTMRAMKSLRYQLELDGNDGKVQVTDVRTHRNNGWGFDQKDSYPKLSRDYAIIARFQDTETDKTVMLIGGIGGDGTKAAAEFLTHPDDLRDISSRLLRNKNQKNFEIVLSTQLINGESGPPRVLATEVW